MTITIVRHGQTEDNYLNHIQGLSNNLMNDTGRRECQRLRSKLEHEHYDICYMSPLVRTVETAFILIGDRVETVTDKRLIERNMGELEGCDCALYDSKKYWDYNLNCSDQGVEPVQDIFKRCKEFLDYVMNKYPDGNILIVSHGSPVRAIHHLLKGTDLEHDNLLDVDICNCYVEKFDIGQKK